MLVLTRREGELIDMTIGDVHVVICVLENRGGKIRLGFTAPDEVRIHRREVTEQISEKRNG